MDQYTVEVGGIPHTMLLTKEDAERYGDKAVKVTSSAPANKARTAPVNKARG